MNKLLIVSNMFPNEKYPSYGIFVKRFCEQLDLLNINYNLCVLEKSSNKIYRLVKYISFYIRGFISYFKRENKIIYIHYASHSSISVLFASLFKKKKIYVNVHGSDVFPENRKQEFFQIFTKFVLKKADKVIVPSEYFKDVVCEKYCIDKKNVFVYPSGGIDSNVFYVKKNVDKIKKNYSIVENKITFGYVGRITSKKGWDVFLKACSLLKKERDDFQFIVVGDGNEINKMDDLIKKENLNDVILFPLLNQNDLSDLYSCLDCFIFPTMRDGESLGLVGLESMACGCPIIASDYAAPKYYVNKNNGYKFKVGDYKELAKCMNDFMSLSKKKLNDMKKNALETAQQYYVNNIIKLLDEIIEGDLNE